MKKNNVFLLDTINANNLLAVGLAYVLSSPLLAVNAAQSSGPPSGYVEVPAQRCHFFLKDHVSHYANTSWAWSGACTNGLASGAGALGMFVNGKLSQVRRIPGSSLVDGAIDSTPSASPDAVSISDIPRVLEMQKQGRYHGPIEEMYSMQSKGYAGPMEPYASVPTWAKIAIKSFGNQTPSSVVLASNVKANAKAGGWDEFLEKTGNKTKPIPDGGPIQVTGSSRLSVAEIEVACKHETWGSIWQRSGDGKISGIQFFPQVDAGETGNAAIGMSKYSGKVTPIKLTVNFGDFKGHVKAYVLKDGFGEVKCFHGE